MFNYIATTYLRDAESEPPLPAQTNAKALLSSTIADGDVITDWLYFIEITKSDDLDDVIPHWLLQLQLISCICGTLAWFSTATDGRAIQWLKMVIYAVLFEVPLYIVGFPFWIMASILRILLDREYISRRTWRDVDKCHEVIEDFRYNVWMNANQKISFVSGSLLFVGIIFEDIPQLIVTFLIEDKIKDGNGTISPTALVNLLFAAFDILHKLAEAWDLRHDLRNAGYAALKTIKHGGGRFDLPGCVESLHLVDGGLYVLAAGNKTVNSGTTT